MVSKQSLISQRRILIDGRLMSLELSHWKDIVVEQRKPDEGCIPTGYEWLIKYHGIQGVNFKTFQDDFNFHPNNSFLYVSRMIMAKYPKIKIQVKDFPNGTEEIKFVRDLIEHDIPCLVVVIGEAGGKANGHSVPVVAIDNAQVTVIGVACLGKNFDLKYGIGELVEKWDKYAAKEITWIAP